MEVLIRADDFRFADELRALAVAAAARLGLDAVAKRLELVVDDVACDERVWFGRVPGSDGAVRIYCHPDQFLKDHGAAFVSLPEQLPWELPPLDPDVEATEPAFAQAKAERFLYHQFLQLRDMAEGMVAPGEVPPDLAEAFQEVWAVTVDGRLRRHGLPGAPIAERRRRFFRVFSRGGLLLPQHWQIFRELWDGDEWDVRGLAAAARELPPLTPRSA